jgi:hypothetical protein
MVIVQLWISSVHWLRPRENQAVGVEARCRSFRGVRSGSILHEIPIILPEPLGPQVFGHCARISGKWLLRDLRIPTASLQTPSIQWLDVTHLRFLSGYPPELPKFVAYLFVSRKDQNGNVTGIGGERHLVRIGRSTGSI